MTIRFFTFLLWLALGLTNRALAQHSPDQYCVLIATGNHYSGLSIRLEYGQDVAEAAAEPALQEDAARVRSLASLVGALNYLSKQGWELVSTTTMPTQVVVPPSNTRTVTQEYYSEQLYILRRRR